MSSAEPPLPGTPKVEFIEPDLARWTFESADPTTQEGEFTFWRGYFGFEETDWPHHLDGRFGWCDEVAGNRHHDNAVATWFRSARLAPRRRIGFSMKR